MFKRFLYFCSMDFNLFHILDLLGTSSFAISGALSAMHKKLDPFGIFIIAFVTAIGGGTLRDVLIGHTPVTWAGNIAYVYLIGGVTIGAIIFRNQIFYLRHSLFLFDTIGLGIFTITGVETGISAGLHPLISIALGVMSASFGGVIRDILCNEIPIIFSRKEIYATPCILGASVFVMLHYYQMPTNFIYIATSLIVIITRLLAVRFNICLPSFSVKTRD